MKAPFKILLLTCIAVPQNEAKTPDFYQAKNWMILAVAAQRVPANTVIYFLPS